MDSAGALGTKAWWAHWSIQRDCRRSVVSRASVVAAPELPVNRQQANFSVDLTVSLSGVASSFAHSVQHQALSKQLFPAVYSMFKVELRLATRMASVLEPA